MPSKRETQDKEKLDKIEEKIIQLNNEKKSIQQRINQKNRKARDHRLIQNGLLVEEHIGWKGIEPPTLKILLTNLLGNPDFVSYLKDEQKRVSDIPKFSDENQ